MHPPNDWRSRASNELSRSLAVLPIVLRDEPARRLPAPSLLEDLSQVGRGNSGQPHKDRWITPIVVGDEERLRIGLHPEVPLMISTLHDQRLTVLPQAGEELPAHTKSRCAIGQSLLDTG